MILGRGIGIPRGAGPKILLLLILLLIINNNILDFTSWLSMPKVFTI